MSGVPHTPCIPVTPVVHDFAVGIDHLMADEVGW